MLPNFLLLGAQKAGTTTLARFFELHPSIFIAKQRETRFFLYPHLYSKGVVHYEMRFFEEWAGEPAVGEKTPEYLVDPGAPKRVAEMLPDTVKFIICLRSPAARAHSGYRQNLAMAREDLPFLEALEAEPSRTAEGPAHLMTFGYMARGMYGRQIKNWVDAIPDFLQRTLVIDFDDLVQQQPKVLAEVAKFLGVEPLKTRGPIRAGSTTTIECPLSIEGDTVLWRGEPFQQPSPELVAFARGNQHARESTQPLSRQDEIALNRKYCADDIKALEASLSRSFAHWLA